MPETQVCDDVQSEQHGNVEDYREEPLYFEGDENGVGFISIKDFAYDKSNPLHYGYFEENEYGEYEDGNEYDGAAYDDDTDNKRQSFILPETQIVNKRAVALYDFEPENDNELELKEGDTIFISYKHGQGWLVAENHDRTHTGLVPEEYISYVTEDEEENGDGFEDKARPFFLTQFITQNMNAQQSNDNSDGEWEDIDDLDNKVKKSLKISD